LITSFTVCADQLAQRRAALDRHDLGAAEQVVGEVGRRAHEIIMMLLCSRVGVEPRVGHVSGFEIKAHMASHRGSK
jgi:hypothetical protein